MCTWNQNLFWTKSKGYSIWKRCVKTKTKGSKFERTRFEPSFGEPTHNFYNVNTWTKGFLTKEEPYNIS